MAKLHTLNMLFRKSVKLTKIANIYSEKGNDFLRRKKYFEALVFFNKSLCHSQPNSIDMSNGFASRSAVYFEMKQYQKCLENIKLARIQSQYKTDSFLDELEHKCKCNQFIYENGDTTINRLSLSYPTHHKVPFIVNCLELSATEKFGRFITTNRDLKPGDVIAIEDSFFTFIDLEALSLYKYQRCFNCLKSSKLNLLPGPHSVMSCSQACHKSMMEKNIDSEVTIQNELDWKVVKMIKIKNYSECIAGNIETLENLFYGNSKTIFDFDLSNMQHIQSQKNLLKCTISLIGGTSDKVDKNIEIFKLMLGAYNERQREFFVRFVDHLMNVCRRTQFSLNVYDELAERFEKIGNCLLPFGGLLNHSCDPNIFWISVDGKFVYIVAKPIGAGEQLFLCYRKTFLRENLEERRKQLQKQYGFVCECSACTHNYPIQEYFDDLKIDQFQTNTQIHNEVEKNWKEIEETFNVQSPNKTAELIMKNKLLLEYVSSKFI